MTLHIFQVRNPVFSCPQEHLCGLFNTVERKITNKNINFFFFCCCCCCISWLCVTYLYKRASVCLQNSKTCEVAELRFLSYRIQFHLLRQRTLWHFLKMKEKEKLGTWLWILLTEPGDTAGFRTVCGCRSQEPPVSWALAFLRTWAGSELLIEKRDKTMRGREEFLSGFVRWFSGPCRRWEDGEPWADALGWHSRGREECSWLLWKCVYKLCPVTHV